MSNVKLDECLCGLELVECFREGFRLYFEDDPISCQKQKGHDGAHESGFVEVIWE